MQLEYAGPAQLSLSAGDLPDRSWPRPRAPRWPFSGELSDYLRVGVINMWTVLLSQERCSNRGLAVALAAAGCTARNVAGTRVAAATHTCR